MPTLAPAEVRRLVGILGRLGSDHDGERAAAGLLASRMLRAAGLGWADVIGAGGGARVGTAASPGGPGAGTAGQGDLTLCLRWLGELSAWEVGFVTDLRTRRRLMTPGQAAKLRQVADALRARGLA